MKILLIVHHSPSPNLQKLLSACQQGVDQAQCDDQLTLKCVPALECQPADVQAAAGIILITPENLGYISGGMKDFFDRIYYPCLEHTQGLPCAAIIRAGSDGTGSRRALESITTGLRWRWVQEPMTLKGDWQDTFCQSSEDLSCAMATALAQGIF